MTSVRDCTLRNNAVLKLHHQKPKLENEILCRSWHERKSDSRKRVEEQIPEGTVTAIPQSTSSSSSSISSGSPTTIATSMQVDETDQDRSKKQKVVHGTDIELEELVMEAEFDRLQRCADREL